MEASFEAIVLRRSNTGESDRRITILSRESGKVDLIAKGSRKPTSRLAAATEPLSYALFQATVGRKQLFVTHVQLKPSIQGIRDDFERMSMAFAFVELIDATAPYEDVNPGLFEFAVIGLTILGLHEQPLIAFLWLLLKLLQESGLAPSFTICTTNGSQLKSRNAFFSLEQGGFTSVSHQYTDTFSVDGEVLVGLEKLMILRQPPHSMKHLSESLNLTIKIWRHHAYKNLPALHAWELQWLGENLNANESLPG